MLTICFILIIVATIASAQKKRHDSPEHVNARRNFPEFVIEAGEMNLFSKIYNLAINSDELLQYISYQKGWVTIRMMSGREISGWLAELHTEFSKNNGLTYYKVISQNGKVKFYSTTNITDNEWDTINRLLCLSRTTRGEQIFGTTYRRMGYVNTVLRAFKFFQ